MVNGVKCQNSSTWRHTIHVKYFLSLPESSALLMFCWNVAEKLKCKCLTAADVYSCDRVSNENGAISDIQHLIKPYRSCCLLWSWHHLQFLYPSPVDFTQVGITYAHTQTHTLVQHFVVLLATPGGLGVCALCKKLRRWEVGVLTHCSRSGLAPQGSAMSSVWLMCVCVCEKVTREEECVFEAFSMHVCVHGKMLYCQCVGVRMGKEA